MQKRSPIFQPLNQENARNYSLELPEIDLTRDTAVYIRQSGRKADKKNGESRKMQEGLRIFAMRLRRQNIMDNIRVYDEGAGKSGGLRIDERPELNRLWQDLHTGLIGQVIVAREDRLFRDEHGDQSGAFSRLAKELDICLFVPTFRADGELDEYGAVVYYNFKNPDHLKEYRRKMDIAADYRMTHVKYMMAAKNSKTKRGAFDGRPLPPGLVLERHAPKDTRKPVLYEPWITVMQWVFERGEELGWNASAMMREVEHMPFLFPEPPEEDQARYEFKTNLSPCAGGGYKPRYVGTFIEWWTNVHLIGWWTVGATENNITTVLVGNHPAIIEEALFRRSYEFNTGQTLEGEKLSIAQVKRSGQVRTKHLAPEALFHGKLTCPSAKGVCTELVRGRPRYFAYTKNQYNIPEHTFSIYTDWIDNMVVQRLRDLADADAEVAERLKKHLEKVLKQQVTSTVSIADQLAEIERKLAILHRRFDAVNNELKGTKEEDQLVASIVRKINGLTKQKELLLSKKDSVTLVNGPEEAEQFYNTLRNFDANWPELPLEAKQRLMDVCIQKIEMHPTTPHWMELRIQWLTAITPRPDLALVWRTNGSQIDKLFSAQELAILREVWPTATSWSEILMRLPTRSIATLKTLASNHGIRKQPGYLAKADYPYNACWADLQAVSDAADAFQKIKEAIEVCRREKKGAHALWVLPADGEVLCQLVTGEYAESFGPYFEEVVSVMP